ncbi:hypothetical protein [Dyella sp. 2RAB6]|uniref:hypothetical protein n=1 Tax=Dyella sp. 2RAB6 TaxID=3232992 RepID=UPI003F908247
MNLLRQGLFAIALFGSLWRYHTITSHRIKDADARAFTAEAQARDLVGELAAQKDGERIVTQYVDRVQIVREKGQSILQKVPVYVPASADAACVVPAGFVRLHDAAAASAMPDRPGAANAQASGVALSAVAGTVVDNYTTCHAIAEQLIALQDWVRVNSRNSP